METSHDLILRNILANIVSCLLLLFEAVEVSSSYFTLNENYGKFSDTGRNRPAHVAPTEHDLEIDDIGTRIHSIAILNLSDITALTRDDPARMAIYCFFTTNEYFRYLSNSRWRAERNKRGTTHRTIGNTSEA